MSTSSGKLFPTNNINPGHIHYDERVSPARAYMYKGGNATDLVNSWTEVDLATEPNIFQPASEKGQVNGYASLGSDGKVPASQSQAGIDIPVTVVQGGTGATTAANARTNLSVSGGAHQFYNFIGTTYLQIPSHIVSQSFGALARGPNLANLMPVIFERNVVLSALFINVTAAGTNVDFAIYNSSNFSPTTVLATPGSVSVASTGPKTLVISQAINKGLYFFAMNPQSNVTITAYSTMLYMPGTNQFDPAIPMRFATYSTAYGTWTNSPSVTWQSLSAPLIGYKISS